MKNQSTKYLIVVAVLAAIVVGSPIHLEIDGNKAKIKTPANKKVECEIVRAEILPTAR